MSIQIPYASHMSKMPSNPIFDLLSKMSDPEMISFAAGMPSPCSFPYEDLARITTKVLSDNAPVLLQYGVAEGYGPLRESAAALIARTGIATSAKDIFLTTGGQQAIDLLCKLLIEPNDPVLVETPTYSATLQILKSYRARPIGVESDENGMLPDDLDKKLSQYRPKFVYIIPTFQNPTGRTLALERRKAIAQITARHGVLLLEDDPYRELRYFGEHLPPIKMFDEGDNILYLASTSKILCPGLRVGIIRVPTDLHRHLVVAKQAADMHSVTLSQAIVDAYLREGLLDEHLKIICPAYRDQLSAMLEEIERHFPAEITFTRPQGGLFICCELPKHVDTAKLLPISVERKVAFIPGDQFYAVDGVKNMMRLNFSNASVEKIRKGIKILGSLLKEEIAKK